MTMLHSLERRPVISHDGVGFVSRILGLGTVAIVAAGAGLAIVYAALVALGALGLL